MANQNNVLKTVERTMLTLEVLSESQEKLSLSDIAEKLSVNKTTLHGLLNTLVILGYVLNEKGMYSLNSRIQLLSETHQNNNLIIDRYHHYIEKIAYKTSTTCMLSIRSGSHHYMIVDFIEQDYKLSINEKRHDFFSTISSATGNIFLAYDKPLLHSLRKGGFITPELERKIKKIQQQGYAVDVGQVEQQTFCLAFPLIFEGKLDASLSLVSHSKEHLNSVLERVILFLTP
ncbi:MULTISPECIES: IclR family transcriptional regulator [Rosenbergiella]|uniref:IclR family transcriptional regulator n=1 Tax=Rosenbergiella TaxID=1356488 RepID=UPI001F4D4FFE|nr:MULTISPECIES: helix-turn-helix domain-containing protein [Rosenbergiella]